MPTRSNTALHAFTADCQTLRAHYVAFGTAVNAQLTALREMVKRFELTYIEETRMRFLTEVSAFFPEVLVNLQCRLCVRDRYCWLGHGQGFTCALFFLDCHTDPLVQTHLATLRQKPLTTDLIAGADFDTLLALCLIYHINIRILSVITVKHIRKLLYDFFYKEFSAEYLLTDTQKNDIFSERHAIQKNGVMEGEKND